MRGAALGRPPFVPDPGWGSAAKTLVVARLVPAAPEVPAGGNGGAALRAIPWEAPAEDHEL